jgi:signal transduction histidine kinase
VKRFPDFTQQLLDAISHDLRGPMSTILIWERVLRDRFEEGTVRWRALDAIRESATLQTNLIAELAQLATTMSAETAARRRIALATLLGAALDTCADAASAKQVTITADYAPQVGVVEADPARLHHAVTKVLGATIDVCPSGGNVTLAAQQAAGSITVTIGENAAGEDGEPVRLGLPLVAVSAIIAMHDGTFRAVRPAAGATPVFRISLPLVAQRSSRA